MLTRSQASVLWVASRNPGKHKGGGSNRRRRRRDILEHFDFDLRFTEGAVNGGAPQPRCYYVSRGPLILPFLILPRVT